MKKTPERRESLCERVFIRYGAGAHVFSRVTKLRFWNLVAWVLIALGICAWATVLWYLRD